MSGQFSKNYNGNGAGLDRVRQIEKIANELAGDLIKALAERDHWKANHDAQVERARVLVERTDMPLERVQAYKLLVAANADHNINDQCTVTLTEAGAKIYNEWGNQHKYPGSAPYRHADGFVLRTQLWSLMQIFGSHIYMGMAQVPFLNAKINIEKSK